MAQAVKRVILATDAHPSYAFYAPLTCMLWAKRGWKPTLIVAWGTSPAPLCLRLPVSAAVKTGADIIYTNRHTNLVEAHRTSTVAQMSRLFAATLRDMDDDYLLTSDIDMWPLGTWLDEERADPKDVDLFFANAYRTDNNAAHAPVKFPICYIGASGATWHEIMVGRGTGCVAMAVALNSMRNCRPEDVTEEAWAWSSDELLFGRRIHRWEGYPDRCRFIDRNLGADGERRLDRSAWMVPSPKLLSQFADAHLPRPGYTDAGWKAVRPLLASILNAGELGWADAYRNTFVEALR